jgi:hypothetical protein
MIVHHGRLPVWLQAFDFTMRPRFGNGQRRARANANQRIEAQHTTDHGADADPPSA